MEPNTSESNIFYINNDKNNNVENDVSIEMSSNVTGNGSHVTSDDSIVCRFKNVFHCFGDNLVLNGLNMSVTNGRIYALIGTKSCGKTSILECIVGLLKPTKGDVTVFGHSPSVSNRIGFMPQGMALFTDFTIKESIYYFGRLYKMEADIIKNKLNSLLKSLSLDDDNILVKTLDQEDKLMVSMAITLIHSPDLLVLDEPTACGDPCLKQSFWNQLKLLRETDGKTIIITSNYLQEARSADVVGLIKDGKLLAQENPDKLMQKMNVETLEDTFYYLVKEETLARMKINEKNKKKQKNYYNNYNNINNNNNNNINDNYNNINMNNNQIVHNEKTSDEQKNMDSTRKEDFAPKTSSSKRISILMSKNKKISKSNFWFLLFQILFPSLAVILFCACIGRGPSRIPIGVFNPDKPSFGSELVLKEMNADFLKLEKYDSLNMAIDAIKTNCIWAVLSFPSNYTRSMLEKASNEGCESDEEEDLEIKDTDESDDNKHSNEDSEESKEEKSESAKPKPTKSSTSIELYMDNTNLLIGGAIKRQILLGLKSAKKKSIHLTSNDVSSSAPPLIVIDPPVYGEDEVQMSEYLTPGIVVATIIFTSIIFPMLTIIKERNEGLTARSSAAGIKSHEFLLSQLLWQALISIPQIILILLIIFKLFNVPLNGSLLLTFLLLFLDAVFGVTLGFLISSNIRDEFNAMTATLSVFFLMITLDGTLWPVECMPDLAQLLNHFLPSTVSGTALRSILSRGWDLRNSQVKIGFLVPSIWAIILLLISIVVFRVRK